MKHENWFLLPSVAEWYYSRNHQDYELLPPWLAGCQENNQEESIALIYPKGGENVYLPITLQSERSRLVAKATHRQNGATVYWHLDNVYLGSTREIHHMEILTGPGEHMLTLIDEPGNSVQKMFRVVSE